MKNLFLIIVISLIALSCKKEENEPTPAPKALNQYEQQLVGTWNHQFLATIDENGDTMSIEYPDCSGERLEFYSTVYTHPFENDLYNMYDNYNCNGIEGYWNMNYPTQINFYGSIKNVSVLTTDSLVFTTAGQTTITQHFIYTR